MHKVYSTVSRKPGVSRQPAEMDEAQPVIANAVPPHPVGDSVCIVSHILEWDEFSSLHGSESVCALGDEMVSDHMHGEVIARGLAPERQRPVPKISMNGAR